MAYYFRLLRVPLLLLLFVLLAPALAPAKNLILFINPQLCHEQLPNLLQWLLFQLEFPVHPNS